MLKKALKPALIISAISITFALFAHFTGLEFENWPNWLAALFSFIALFMLSKKVRMLEYGDQWSYGQAFSFSLLTSFIAVILVSLFNYIYVKMINPTYLETFVEMNGPGMEMMENPEMFAFMGFGTGFISNLIVCLIFAIFLQKKS